MEANKPIELWGGVECTINRVGDRYFNQLELSGHWQRAEDDLERFAELGLRTLRFPVLWESVAPNSLDQIDWSWPDVCLAKLRELKIRPIVGLLHHGSGPCYTDLLDPDFSDKLARFAEGVAQRYPWIDAYTPVNEPLTTARFSALYGHWYPHATDARTFARAMLNQCRGVSLAMRAIRKENPDAILVQTEDLGYTFSTPRLAYQADFENQRRWLAWDLLRGSVEREHPMWTYLDWLGINVAELEFFADSPSPADIIGINYYVTSERYLDQDLENYPRDLWGSNGHDAYADDAAVRARGQGIAGVEAVINQAFRRYKTPLALTEVHLGCAEDEQLRWFLESWHAAEKSLAKGVDVRAVTAWSLLGSFDWNNLVTELCGHYEAGVFDLQSGAPRATLLASAVQSLAKGNRFHDAKLHSSGWWHHPSRLRRSVATEPAEGAMY